MGQLMRKDEIIKRFNILNDNFVKNLADKANIDFVKKIIDSTDNKFDAISD